MGYTPSWKRGERGRRGQPLACCRALARPVGRRYVSRMSPLVFQLQHLREHAGLSQRELAEKLGVSNRAISDLETGETRRIDLDLLDRIAKFFDVSPGDLFAQVD